MIAVSAGVIVALVALEAALFAVPFCRDIRGAGGVRNLYAHLTGTASPAVPAPAPEPPEPAVPWWLSEDAGLAAKPTPLAACWEPADRPEVAGVPPWDAAAASQGTGYTKFHAVHLKELLGGDAS